MRQGLSRNPFFLGMLLGLLFGVVDLAWTWRAPLADDSPGALLRFYGPMFLAWALVSFRVAHGAGRVSSGAAAGVAVACGTFCVFVLLNFIRVNVFLEQLAGRPDWRNMMTRFRGSGLEDLRLFVNLDYLKGTPFKVGVAAAVGAVMGILGGLLGCLAYRHRERARWSMKFP